MALSRCWADIWISYVIRKEDEFRSEEEMQRMMSQNNRDKDEDPMGEDLHAILPPPKTIPPPN